MCVIFGTQLDGRSNLLLMPATGTIEPVMLLSQRPRSYVQMCRTIGALTT